MVCEVLNFEFALLVLMIKAFLYMKLPADRKRDHALIFMVLKTTVVYTLIAELE